MGLNQKFERGRWRVRFAGGGLGVQEFRVYIYIYIFLIIYIPDRAHKTLSFETLASNGALAGGMGCGRDAHL